LKNTILIIALIFLSTNLATADSCVQLKKDSIKVKWTAFKTPAKVGVSGLLKGITVTGPKSGPSVKAILLKSSFSITTDKTSVDSKNPARDAKIAKAFFSTLKNNGTISGTVSGFTKKDKILNLTLNLNGVQKKLPLNFSVVKNKLVATGFVDVLDYSMGSQLAALNKACFAKHEGKTWSDVEVKLTAQFEACSK
jgi:polyisoprenoid-binding protein YceI